MKRFIAGIVTRWRLVQAERLLSAPTLEGKAAREQGLRDVEAVLLAREDWSSPQEREQELRKFYAYAAQVRARDAQIQP